jgi:alpha-L-rhamnosidase
VVIGPGIAAPLTERANPPLTIPERLKPVAVLKGPRGFILDFGQEITGWVEFVSRAPAATRVILSHCEILEDGDYYGRNLGARAEFVYVADGSLKTARPHFTYFGFRYVRVIGLATVSRDDFTACAIYSDIPCTGTIETSDARLNRLVLNTQWSQKGNFLDIPTDCPQRCERIGWCGDVTAFCDTASQHMHTPAFFDHYLKCLRAEQIAMGGLVPIFAPVPKSEEGVPWFDEFMGSSVWGDVGSILPWSLWLNFGDFSLLKRHWPLIRDWADWVTAHSSNNLWFAGNHFGDWLALDTGDPESPRGATSEAYIASAFYFQTLTIAAKAARVLELPADQARFEAQAAETRTAFLAEFFSDGALRTAETQTALVVALHFGLYPDGFAPRLMEALVKRIEAKKGHLDTGFVGTFLLPRVLSDRGANEVAYALLLQDTFPSWLFEVAMGATTIWERWNSVRPDGRMNTALDMNSLNHYAYGSIAGWMYHVMCGLNPVEDAVGYKKAVVKPMPDPRVKSVKMVRDTAAGRYEIEWEYRESVWHVKVIVPFDCEALVALPGRDEQWVPAGEYVWDCPV